jgi:DNA polymerase-3 subunit gamma/tau
MLNVSRPVAASASGLVVAFNFDIIRHNAMQKNDLLQTMVTQIRELTQAANERQLVFITSDDWQQLRAKYVAQLPNQHTQAQPIPDEMATQISDEPAIDQPVEQADNLITEAKNIFDEALVEEVDD